MFTKVDIFSHIMTKKYTERYAELNPAITRRVEYYTQPVVDLSVREKLMHRYPDVLQVITMANIPLEKFVPEHTVEMARIGNEELAELVLKRPDLFYGAVAVLPLNDIDAALEEIDYAINKLHLAGIQVQTRIGSEWLASEKYRPILAKMAELNKPIWIHPDNNDQLEMDIGIFNWPFETSHCMLRLVQAGIFNDFPDIKFIVHHAGAMVPFFKERVRTIMPQHTEKFFKRFYTDTALYGNTPGLMSAFDFFGPDHLMFGTDAPMGAPRGTNGNTDRTIRAIEKMDVSDEDKEKIFQGNAVDMFGKLI